MSDAEFSPYETLEEDMAARVEADGIPRSIVNGKIMKWDWQLDVTDKSVQVMSTEELSEHIDKLINNAKELDND